MDRKAFFLMVLAQVAFTIMVVFVKVARQELHSFSIVLWRSVFALPLLMLLLRNVSWKISNLKIIFLRIVLGFGAMTSFFTAAKGMGVADLSLISRVQPLLVALLASFWLGNTERSSKSIWWLIGLSMIGCGILLAPSLEIGFYYGAFALLAAVFSAHAHLCLRSLKNENSGVVVLWFQFGSGCLAVPACLAIGEPIAFPPSQLLVPLIIVAISATLGQLFMTYAYRRANAAPVAMASYMGPLVAVFADVLAFGVFPTWNVYVGGTLVVWAGILLSTKKISS